MRTIIKQIICVVFIFNIISITSQSLNNPNVLAYHLVPDQISLDGKWAIYNKIDLDGNPPDNTEFINTQTQKLVSLKRNTLYYSHLLNDGITLKKESDTLSIINLETSETQKEFSNIKQFDSNKKNNNLFTLTNQGILEIYLLTNKKQSRRFHRTDVEKFFLNQNKTTLIYQENSESKKLYFLDLKTLKEVEICSLEQNITTIKWNLSQDAILFDSDYNNSTLIHLPTLTIKEIELPKEPINAKKIDFYANNDLLITYNITTDQKYAESEYLDIWQGNSKHIVLSDFKPKYKIDYYTKVYKFNIGRYITLESGRNIQYSPITIPNYVLYYDPLEKEDFLNTYVKNKYIIKNIITGEKKLLSSYEQNPLKISPDNKHLLYPKKDGFSWEVFTPDTNKRTLIENDNINNQKPLWSIDSKFIYYFKNNNLHKLSIETNESIQLTHFAKGTKVNIKSLVLSPIKNPSVDSEKPLIIQISKNNANALYKIENNKISIILPFTTNRIDKQILFDSTFNLVVWMEENYNMPHKINMYKNKKAITLVENTIPKESYLWQKRKDIKFKDKYGKELEGFLFYPKDFDPKESYPMVTHIYEDIWFSPGLPPNIFIQPTLRNPGGHNRALLNENGYFVFYPDTYVSKDGPGLTAVDCVEKAIEKILKEEPAINKNKLGISGYSFGAYKTSFIASHSNTFAAIISGAGRHDLIGSYYSYGYDFRNKPDYTRIENGQFYFKESFGENPQKYLDNSPILFAQNVKTPILLVTGLKDTNVFWQNTSSMYWALKRYNNTQVIALFYRDGEHGFYFSPEIGKDYTKRYMDWFDYYLKGNNSIIWIEEGVNPKKTSYSL